MPFRLPTAESGRCLVMGVLNVTPDSFSDGGRYQAVGDALHQADQMLRDGADIIDVGGESTRPGAAPVSLQQELDRVIPVIESLARELACSISIDSSKPGVMQAAVEAGANMINDVLALRADGAVETAVKLKVPVCLMHMQGEPRNMQAAPAYKNVVAEVSRFLRERVQVCLSAGMDAGLIVLDPGFGFGKTLDHNLDLLRKLDSIAGLGYPVLAGVSRKSMIGQLLDRDAGERLPGSLALAILARQRGASILRVHDVAPTVDALRVLEVVTATEGQNE